MGGFIHSKQGLDTQRCGSRLSCSVEQSRRSARPCCPYGLVGKTATTLEMAQHFGSKAMLRLSPLISRANQPLPMSAKQRLRANGFRQTNHRKSKKCSAQHWPWTESGKRRSRRNAIRHGLTAETVIDILEDPADYRAFERAIKSNYSPQTAIEGQLVTRLASLLWRLPRRAYLATQIFCYASARHHFWPPGHSRHGISPSPAD